MVESECDGVAADHFDSPDEIKLVGDATNGVDYISSLPDAILHDILSYNLTKFTIRTSVLSKRWKHEWYGTPYLSFDCDKMDNPGSISKTLASLWLPKIMSFDVTLKDDVTVPQLDSWIEFAMSRNAESLSIKLKSDYSFQDFFIRPVIIIRFDNLLQCRLGETWGFPDVFDKCNVSWTSLRNLSLDRCDLPDESIANILSGCLLLESLTLNFCQNFSRLDLSKSLNLTRLEVIGNDILRESPTEIVVPHIHYLRLTNFYKPPTLLDVSSSLTEAKFDLHSLKPKDNFIQDMVLSMLAKLQNIEKLTIGAIVLQILSLTERRVLSFPQLKIKALTVETSVVRSVMPGIVRLLQNSPSLKKITFHTMECNMIVDCFDRGWSGFFPTVEQTSSLFDGIAKDAKSERVAFFLKLLLRNTETLETMVLRLGGYLNAIEYQKLLTMIPTVSSSNDNVGKYGRAKAILNSFKIIP